MLVIVFGSLILPYELADITNLWLFLTSATPKKLKSRVADFARETAVAHCSCHRGSRKPNGLGQLVLMAVIH